MAETDSRILELEADWLRIKAALPKVQRFPKGAPVLHRLVYYSEVSGSCWLWQGRTDSWGYGRIGVGRDSIGVHRVSFELSRGLVLPRDRWALHHCDNPPCLRPSHLFEGTSRDNAADRSRKGRSAWGDKSPRAKLSNQDVIAIRGLLASGTRVCDIAAQFGVVRTAISNIKSGLQWKGVK
jgi:hypothetical protein